jgi:fibronectin type 3 domain-containing protein
MNKLFVGILMASVLIGILAVIPENVIAETWSIETVDSTGDVGELTSMALDSNGYPHISYSDITNRYLKYAKWTGSAWSNEAVDSGGNVGGGSSIALDSNGYPHISYYDFTNYDLKYAKWTGREWLSQTVDSANNVGCYSSIVLDSNGHPHISYSSYTLSALKYAKWTGREWSIETVNSAGYVDKFTSIALDSKGYPHISYSDVINEDLKYAKWTGSAWSIEAVDSDGDVGGSSIALDSNGYPHISYFTSYNSDIKYAKWTGSAWSIKTVDAGIYCWHTSMALDSNGYPHISYHFNDNVPKYAKWTGSAWSIETVDSTDEVGWHTSMVLDNNDYPHISYLNRTNDYLKYAKLMPKVPTQPENLKATAGDSYVYLNWDAPSDDGGSPIIGYRIYRGKELGGEVLLKEVGDVYIFTDKNVENGRTYYYYVCTVNSVDIGEKSEVVEVTPNPVLTTPSAPQKLTSSPGDCKVTLEWDTPSDDGGSLITGYRIYRGKEPIGEVFVEEVDDRYTFFDENVENNRTYYYYVCAVNSVDIGEKSEVAEVTPNTALTTPSAPQKLTSSPGNRKVTLEWDAPSDDGGSLITGYRIYRGKEPIGEVFVEEVVDRYTFSDENVENDRIYYYYVYAVNSVGRGERSEVVNATPQYKTPPSAPQKLSSSPGNRRVTLEWDAPGDDGGTPVTGYKIYRGTTSRGEKTLLTTVGNVLTYTDKNVTNNQTYYYDVSAVNSVGEGIRKSNEVSATPEKKYEWGLIIALIAAAAGIAGVIINYLISRKRRYGSISATSCPDDAIVFLDGGDKGESPVTFDKTKKGTHIVLFSKPGYYDCEKRVVVNADQITAVHCDLKKMEMKLRLSSEPTEIPADGK